MFKNILTELKKFRVQKLFSALRSNFDGLTAFVF